MHDSLAVSALDWDLDVERSLVKQACEDPKAFAALYERYRDRVYWYLRTRTVNPEDAADLLQQVFLKALNSLPQYRPRKGPFAGWLFAIARNAAINFNRSRRPTVAWDLIPESLRPATTGPEAAVLRHEESEYLGRLFARLDPDKRELLVLRFVAGLTTREIALAINVSEAATKKRLARTLHFLKEHYHDNPR